MHGGGGGRCDRLWADVGSGGVTVGCFVSCMQRNSSVLSDNKTSGFLGTSLMLLSWAHFYENFTLASLLKCMCHCHRQDRLVKVNLVFKTPT